MSTLFNDTKTSGILSTKDGPVLFKIDGNEVSIMENKESHGAESIKLSSMTFQYMYDAANNKAFEKWNPGQLSTGIFHINEESGLIGIYLEIMDRADESKSYAMEIYRHDVGSLMEVLFVMGALGENLCDCEGNAYKFATLIGVSDVFDRYVKLLQSPTREPSMNYLMYVAGKVRGFCEMNAFNAENIASIVNEVTLSGILNYDR